MDAEKLLQAFSVQETQELAAALPEAVLIEEVNRRGIEVPGAIGASAAQGAAVEVNPAKTEFETNVANFLNPEFQIDTVDQLAIITDFWNKLGHDVPDLSEEQQALIAKTVKAHPLMRVVPTPLLDLGERKAIAEKARQFSGQQFSTSYDALWTLDESWIYGNLLADPDATVKEGRDTYGLRYKTRTGEIVGRRAYVRDLEVDGQAVEGKDDTTWVFPVMDVRVCSDRTYASAGELHQKVDSIVTPESLIAMQLLHQANGTPNKQWEVDFANEAVYKLNKKGEAVAPVRVAGVYWLLDIRRIYLRSWGTDRRRDGFGVRGAVSGL